MFIGIGGNLQRYLSVAVPPMILLSSKYVYENTRKINFRLNDALYFIFFTIVFIIFLYHLNNFGVNAIFSIQNLDFSLVFKNPYFIYWGSVTTIYLMRIYTYLSTLLLTFVLFISYLYINRRNDKISKIIFILLISLNLAYNTLVLKESFFPTIGYNYSQATYDIINYSDKVDGNIYALSVKPLPTISKNIKFMENSEIHNKFFLLLQWSLARINDKPNKEVKEILDKNKCTIIKDFYSNGFKFASLYECK